MAILCSLHASITSLSLIDPPADGFNESWLGRELDLNALDDLKRLEKKFHINIGGEGGEYETFVTDCPLFKKRIVIKEAEKIWDKTRGEFIIKKVILADKSV